MTLFSRHCAVTHNADPGIAQIRERAGAPHLLRPRAGARVDGNRRHVGGGGVDAVQAKAGHELRDRAVGIHAPRLVAVGGVGIRRMTRIVDTNGGAGEG